MPIDNVPLDPYNFSEYCKRKNALPTEDELVDILSFNFCSHIIQYGKNKGKFCMKKSIKDEKIHLGYCSKHNPNIMLLFTCNADAIRGKCNQKVRNNGDLCYYHKPKNILRKKNTMNLIKHKQLFKFGLIDFVYNKINKNQYDLFNIYNKIEWVNYSIIYIDINFVDMIYYFFDLFIVFSKSSKYRKTIKFDFIKSDDLNTKEKEIEDINLNDVFLRFDEIIQSSKIEIEEISKRYYSINKEYNMKNINIESNKLDLIDNTNFITVNNQIDYKYFNKVNKILEYKTYIPLSIFLETMKNFLTKFHEFSIEIKNDFPNYYKRIKNYFEIMESVFNCDAVRLMRKADIYSILKILN